MKQIYRNRRSLLVFLFLFTIPGLFAQVNLSSGLTPQQLVQSLVGPGVTVSNVTFTGALSSTAFFTEPSGSFGMHSGIIMTTGTDTLVPGPNNSSFAGDDNGLPGDSLLDQYIDTSLATFDACVLEFDFVPTTDSIAFNYVFGSEEYNEFVWQGFNDIFGFFISGPGIPTPKNIALVPGTTTPVSIDSINNGYAPVGTLPTGPCNNCQYYIDNTNGTILQYDGYTTLLTAGTRVQPCGTYHIKLAIADVGDGVYDSGIFLEAGSFKSTAAFTIIYDGNPAPSLVNICPGECATLYAPPLANYLWSTGDTTPFITACTPDFYSVSTNVGTCHASSNLVNVTALAGPTISTPTLSNDSALSSASGIGPLSYQWYSNGTPVNGATSENLALPFSGCFYVTVTDFNGCTATSDSVCDYSVGINTPGSLPEFSASVSSDGYLNVILQHSAGQGVLTLTDVSGKVVFNQHWIPQASRGRFAVSNLSKGVYFLRMDVDGGTRTKRIIVQ